MPEFDTPLSRNEAILQNICGAENVLVLPKSRIEELLQAIYFKKIAESPEDLEQMLEDAGIDLDEIEPESRIEKLLFAIYENGEYTDEPQSRNEEILKAILTGGDYDEEPQSRIESLLIQWLEIVKEG